MSKGFAPRTIARDPREAPRRMTPLRPPRLPTMAGGLACGRFRLHPQGRPWVMGILNITPDSFSDGGRFFSSDAALRQGLRMAEDGADLIDVGGESTRPGAVSVSCAEELRRVLPVIRRLTKRLPIPISIDTSKAEVARQALEAGASLVNDVTALRGDPAMGSVVARARVPVILMHMRGTPRTMQQRPRYRDVVREVLHELRQALHRAERAGIARTRLLIDPGLGFGKTVRHNVDLLQATDRFAKLAPVVLGPSRKSFIGHVLGGPASERVSGTLACVLYGAARGAAMVRVHDVKPAVQALTMWQALCG